MLFKKKEQRGVMLTDHENLWLSIPFGSPTDISAVNGFDNLITKISTEVGQLINVYVFLPPHAAHVWAGTYHKLGFYPIVCPRVPNKDMRGEERDTVDETLMRYAADVIENTRDLTFLVLVSGDKDFSPLVRRAKRKGLKVIIVAASIKSLSNELIHLASKVLMFEPDKTG